MPDEKSGFLATTAALLALAFVVGFSLALASIGRSGLLYKFVLGWELTRALLYLAALAPAILLVSSALAMESSTARDGFSGEAARMLTPALGLAVVISLFQLLVVPGLEQRANRYESQSQLFRSSLKLADQALREGRLEDAQKHLQACASIDVLDESYSALNDRVQSTILKAQGLQNAQETDTSQTSGHVDEAAWKAGNRFYLEALEARKAGRLFDAHYLAKRSAAIYDKRPDVRRLVEETWRDLQTLGPSAESLAAAAYYKRKLEGYERFQEGDYLAAYRIYSALAAEKADDSDVKAYLARSAEGLSTIAFFIEDDTRAFSRSDEREFSMSLSSPDGLSVLVRASRAAVSEDAVYFRDIMIDMGERLRVGAPFARLHDSTIILRAIDGQNPYRVWEPLYEAGKPAAQSGRTGPVDPGYALQVPFNQEDAALAIDLSGKPGDIALSRLALSLDDARRLGIDTLPLLTELARRAAYPFSVLMLVLLGAGFGLRFKPTEPVSRPARYLGAPVMVALSLPPLRVVSGVQSLAIRALASAVPDSLFLPAWIGFLGLCVAVCLVVAARIAGRSTS